MVWSNRIRELCILTVFFVCVLGRAYLHSPSSQLLLLPSLCRQETTLADWPEVFSPLPSARHSMSTHKLYRSCMMTADMAFKGQEGNMFPPTCWDVPKPAVSEHAQILGLLPPWVAAASLGTLVSLFFFLRSLNRREMIMQRTHVDADFCCVTYTFLSTSLQGYENKLVNGHSYFSVVPASLSLCSMHKHSDLCCSVSFRNSCTV